MKVLPVLDLLNGIVVRGVAGRRSEYRPLISEWVDSAKPLDVARSLRSAYGFRRFYLADLDAIISKRPNWSVYRELIDDGFEIIVDAGIDSTDHAASVWKCGANIIVGLESCPSPQILSQIVSASPREPYFSLDLLGGRPLLSTSNSTWFDDPCRIVDQLVACGIQKLIVLDLSDVGTSSGGRTDELCRWILQQFPGLELTCGGGVRGLSDLLKLRDLGIANVLVASALHDARLTPDSLAQFC